MALGVKLTKRVFCLHLLLSLINQLHAPQDSCSPRPHVDEVAVSYVELVNGVVELLLVSILNHMQGCLWRQVFYFYHVSRVSIALQTILAFSLARVKFSEVGR